MSRTERENLAARIFEALDPYEVADQGGTVEAVLDTLNTDPAAIINYLLEVYS